MSYGAQPKFKGSNRNNTLLQDQNFLNYLNKTQYTGHQTSLTPNPKLFEINRAEIIRRKHAKADSRKEGENFAGLQTYIISEIDSGSDNGTKNNKNNAKNGLQGGFLSDASSFSNSDSDDQNARSQNSSSSEEENHELGLGAALNFG